MVAAKEADNVEEGCQYADGICTAAETEKPDLVPFFVRLAQKAVGAKNVVIETMACCQAEHAYRLLLDPLPRVLKANRADAGVVVTRCCLVFVQNAIELQHVRDCFADFITRAVTADDDVLSHAITDSLISRGSNKCYDDEPSKELKRRLDDEAEHRCYFAIIGDIDPPSSLDAGGPSQVRTRQYPIKRAILYAAKHHITGDSQGAVARPRHDEKVHATVVLIP
jgi:hypothetical protein